MQITVKENEYGETNLILVLSATDLENLQDGSGIAYALEQEISAKRYDIAIVKEKSDED